MHLRLFGGFFRDRFILFCLFKLQIINNIKQGVLNYFREKSTIFLNQEVLYMGLHYSVLPEGIRNQCGETWVFKHYFTRESRFLYVVGNWHAPLVYVIGLWNMQFWSNWIIKIPRTAKIEIIQWDSSMIIVIIHYMIRVLFLPFFCLLELVTPFTLLIQEVCRT